MSLEIDVVEEIEVNLKIPTKKMRYNGPLVCALRSRIKDFSDMDFHRLLEAFLQGLISTIRILFFHA